MKRAADPARPWKILAITSAATFAAALDTSIMFMAFPDISRTFADVSRADLSWVINAYTIVFAALLVPFGRLADRTGRKRVFLAGVGLFTAASALCGAAPSPELLVAARSLQAVGGAMLFPASLALVLNEFPEEKRAMSVAVWGGVGALAAALGPSVGGVVIDLLDWRWAFYMNLPVGIIATSLGLRLLRESRSPDAEATPDLAGVPLMIVAVGALAFGIVQSDEWGWGDERTLGAFAVGLTVLPLFLVRSATHASPALDLKLFRDHNFRMANAATAVFSIAFAAMFFGLVQFLTFVWGYSILEAGLTIWPGPLTASIVAPLAGRRVDRIGYKTLMFSGGLLFAAGTGWLLLRADFDPDLWGTWIPSAILTGVGVGFVMPSLSSAAVRSLPPGRYAVGSAVNQTIRQLGSVLGVSLVVALLGTPTPQSLLGSFDRVFALMVGGGVVAGLISLTIRTPRAPVLEAVAVTEKVPA